METHMAFSEKLLPVVRPGEFVQFGPMPDFGKVLQIEPIQEKIIDFCAADLHNGNLAANGSANDRTVLHRMDTEFEVEPLQFLQIRLVPIDDVLIEVSHPGAASILYATKEKTTYISKGSPKHTAKYYATDKSEHEVWDVSDNDDAGQRVARLKKLILTEDAAVATVVSIGDGSGVSLANAKLNVAVAASSSVTLQEDKIPELNFEDSVYMIQSTTNANLLVAVEVEEDNPSIHTPGAAEIFVLEKEVPYIRLINPLNIAQSVARVGFAGFKYYFQSMGKDLPPGQAFTYLPTARHGSLRVLT